MRRLIIRMKKKPDGSSALSCVREDGSTTWQSLQGSHAAFFPYHDLTHFAVETVLEHRLGFYGLVASGWDLSDFGSPWPRGPIPTNADASELFVGLFDAERAMGVRWTAEEFGTQLAAAIESFGGSADGFSPPDQATLDRIRSERMTLFKQWDELTPGDTLEICFDPDASRR